MSSSEEPIPNHQPIHINGCMSIKILNQRLEEIQRRLAEDRERLEKTEAIATDALHEICKLYGARGLLRRLHQGSCEYVVGQLQNMDLSPNPFCENANREIR